MTFRKFKRSEYPYQVCCANCFGCGKHLHLSERRYYADEPICTDKVEAQIFDLGQCVLRTNCCSGPVCRDCARDGEICCMFCCEETGVHAIDKDSIPFASEFDCYNIIKWFEKLDEFNRFLDMLGENPSSFFRWLKQTTHNFYLDRWYYMNIIGDEEKSQIIHSFKQFVAISKSAFCLTVCRPFQRRIVRSKEDTICQRQLAIEFFRMCHLECSQMTFRRKEITSQCLLGFVGELIARMTHSEYVLQTAWNPLFAIIFYRLNKKLLKL